tara:strand:- start:5722 stop:6372 length:651 start_codon:yes stop_codon:yes gene_type:complete
MSKFLPFINENSTEHAVFKAVLQRSKGSSLTALTDLFSVLLGLGIEEARKRIDALPKELTVTNKIKELVANHPQYHIKKSVQLFWSYITDFERRNVGEGFKDYSKTEIEVFVSVLAIRKLERLQELGFQVFTESLESYKKYSQEDFNPDVADINGLLITESSSQLLGFVCLEELKAFIATKENTDSVYNFMPVFIDVKREELTEDAYYRNHCVSPY